MLENIKINENVYRIINGGCDCYLINNSIPVLIDCGCCKDNIKEYCESLINKSIENVLITHSHIDHTGHCGLFKHVYMTKGCSLSSKNPMDENPQFLDLDYQIKEIKHNQVLEFDDLKIVVILANCHSRDNVMFLDLNHRLLFTGDEIDQDQVLLLPPFCEKKGEYQAYPATCVKTYQKMLNRLYVNYHKYFDYLCTGHNGSPLVKSKILDMIDLCQDILNGEKGINDLSSKSYDISYTHFPYPNANYLRYSKHGLALVYCADDLFDSKNNNKVQPATLLHKMCHDNLE